MSTSEAQATDTNQDGTKRKPVQRQLKVTLTRDEVEARFKRLAAANLEENAIQAEKATAMASFNERLKDKREEIDRLAIATTSGAEELEVDCYEEPDERRGMMLTRRGDNHEIIDERALTAEERQGKLFAGGESNDEDDDEDEDGDDDDDSDDDADEGETEASSNKPKGGKGRGRARLRPVD